MKDQFLTGIFTRVFPSALIWQVNTSEKVICLTFDDGPAPGLTMEILDILDHYQAKATFFCVGENVVRYPEIYAEILKRGHATGNHTHRHLKGWGTPARVYFEDVAEARKHIQSKLFRPPYGLMTYRQAKTLSKDYRVVMWSVLTKDYDASVSEQACYENALNGIWPGSVIVFHDNVKARERVLFALPRLLEEAKRRGFRSVSLENAPES